MTPTIVLNNPVHIKKHCSLVVLIRLVVVRSPYNVQVQPRELHLGLRKSVTVIDYSVYIANAIIPMLHTHLSITNAMRL